MEGSSTTISTQPSIRLRPPLILGLGALYEDILLTVPHYPHEDDKLRATRRETRLGGNLINTFTVLAEFPDAAEYYRTVFCSAVGSREKCGWVEEQLQEEGIEPALVYNEGLSTLPQAFIVNSQETGSRTIISHRCDVPEVPAEDLIARFIRNPAYIDFPFWLHIEGRNCHSILAFLTKCFDIGFKGIVSIDCERVRDGLEDLIAVADVLFLSEIYARTISGLSASVEYASQGFGWQLLAATLEKLGEKIKPGAQGYLTLGAHGVWVFVRLPTTKQMLPEGCEGTVRILPLRLAGGVEFACMKVDAEKMGEGEVVETTGAGDTFIAGVIFWGVMKKRGSLWETARLAVLLAGAKCRRYGFKGLWTEERFRGEYRKLGRKVEMGHLRSWRVGEEEGGKGVGRKSGNVESGGGPEVDA